MPIIEIRIKLMIRKATSKDFKSIMALIRLNLDTFSESEIPSAEKCIKELIKKQDKENEFFVAVDSEKIIGCAGYSKQDDTSGVYFLCWLVVHPDFKRQGIATELYNHIETKLKSLRARLIILNAGSNEVNKFFYRKMGFKTCGTIPKYYSETKNLIWYYKPI